MGKYKDFSVNRVFSHIYIEEGISEHPVAERIKNKFDKSRIIPTKHYKDVFNRKNQLFSIQKESGKLILARRENSFYYKGSDMCDSYCNKEFYYSTNVINCIYDCEYCYLRGIYQSANMVVFVNIEDTFREIKKLQEKKKVFLCISYDTDLLALESLAGFVQDWLDFSSKHENLFVELRTKSANFDLISHKKSRPRFTLAWSISPDCVIKKYERGTPSLSSRLDNIEKSVESGWETKICIDPIIYEKDWEKSYTQMADVVKERIDIKKLSGISMGVFRVPSYSLKNMRKAAPDSAFAAYPFVRDESGKSYTYKKDLGDKMAKFVEKLFM